MNEVNAPLAAHRDHRREWKDFLYVYPVISRRSHGVSLGVNLNPDKICNFDCVYCEVDRRTPPRTRIVDLDLLERELRALLDVWKSGDLFRAPPFALAPPEARRLNDIAFSGDGEPTTCPLFPEAIALAAEVRRSRSLDDVLLRVITDGAYLSRPRVREALTLMDANNGEIWAKLDAGTEEYYRLVNRPNVPLATVLANTLDAARRFRVVIQSLWMNVRGQPPADAEIDAFAGRLVDILNSGGRLRLVQVYTVARHTAEPYVTPLTGEQLHAIGDRVRRAVDVPIDVFGS